MRNSSFVKLRLIENRDGVTLDDDYHLYKKYVREIQNSALSVIYPFLYVYAGRGGDKGFLCRGIRFVREFVLTQKLDLALIINKTKK